MEQMNYNLLFRWFTGMSIDETVWDHSTFIKIRNRVLDFDIIPALFVEVVDLARKRERVNDDHFSVDGTLIQAWASQKSFRRKDEGGSDMNSASRNAESDLHGEKRSNETHESKTDTDARNHKKSKCSEAKLAYLGHSVIENRNGSVVNAKVTLANGYGEWEAAIDMLAELPGAHRKTVATDKNYDTKECIAGCQGVNTTPHVAQNIKHKGGSAIDGRTTRHEGYAISTKKPKRVEEPFGWGKTVGHIRQVKVRGLARVNTLLKMTFIGWNLTRIINLQDQCAL
jgi:IS5 family transposase